MEDLKGKEGLPVESNEKPPEPENKPTSVDDITALIDSKLSSYSKKQDDLKNLTETEKAKKLLEEREQKLLERETKTKTKEFKLLASEKLKAENVPTELMEFLNYADEKNFNASLVSIIDTFKKSVESVVTDKLKAEPPKTGGYSGVDEEEDKILRVMGLK